VNADDPFIRVLLVEDDPEDAIILRETITEVTFPRFDLTHAPTLGKALDLLATQRADAVLLDLTLPDSRGFETFRRVHERFPDVPVVMLTGVDDEGLAMKAVQAGAQDYLVKGQVTGSLLARSIRYAIERQRTSHYRAVMLERERFDAAVRQMSDAIALVDHEWRILTANHAASLLLNLPDGWKGAPLDAILEPFMLSEPIAKLKAAKERVTAFDISRPQTRPPLFLDARLSRQRDSAGSLVSAVLILRDVTEERCEQRIRADFFALLSHKLRTPLTVLTSYLHLFKQLPSEVMQKQWPELLKAFERELGRMTRVVSTLLDFKAFSTRQLETEAKRTDLKSVAAASAYEARRTHSSKSVEVTLQVAGDAVQVDASAEHLSFILEKLLDNAVKFCDKTPVRVSIRTEREDPATVRISISDNGPGVPHEYYDRVFQGFVQLESRPTGQVSGLGLGLYMARQVVEAYGGRMAMQSRLGEGTTVSFTLPFTQPATVEAEGERAGAAQSEAGRG